jgi:hypothetical protein
MTAMKPTMMFVLVAALVTAAACRRGDAPTTMANQAPASGGEAAAQAQAERVTGIRPKIKQEDGRLLLELLYPRTGPELETYMDRYEIVADAEAERLAEQLGVELGYELQVTIERVSARQWRIVSVEPRSD